MKRSSRLPEATKRSVLNRRKAARGHLDGVTRLAGQSAAAVAELIEILDLRKIA